MIARNNINPPPRMSPGIVFRSPNVFEQTKKEVEEIQANTPRLISTNFGEIYVDTTNKQIMGVKGKDKYVIASVIPVQVTMYIDLLIENKIFYEITFERLNEELKIEEIKIKDDIIGVANQIRKYGFVHTTNHWQSTLTTLVQMMQRDTTCFSVKRGIFRTGVFWNKDTEQLFLGTLHPKKVTPEVLDTALEYFEYCVQVLFKGGEVTKDGEEKFDDLRRIIMECFRWSIVSVLSFSMKQRYGSNANKEVPAPLLLGDRDTFKTSIMEFVLSIWEKHQETVISSGLMDTPKQLSNILEESTIPMVGDEAGYILKNEEITTILKTATTSLFCRNRMYDGVDEISLALRIPALTTNEAASHIPVSVLNRFKMMNITYGMSFYKRISNDDKKRFKEEKVTFKQKLAPIGDYLLGYFTQLGPEESKQIMLGDTHSISDHLLEELYKHSNRDMPIWVMDKYVEDDETIEDPTLIDKEIIEESIKNHFYKFKNDFRNENWSDIKDGFIDEDAYAHYVINKVDWIETKHDKDGNLIVCINSKVTRIKQLDGRFTWKELAEKLDKKIVNQRDLFDKKRIKVISFDWTEFLELVP